MLTAGKGTILFRSAENELVCVLSNSSECRQLGFGTDWNVLRVGIRWNYRKVNGSANNLSFFGFTGAGNSSTFGLGLCAANTPTRQSDSSHFCGIVTSSGAGWLESDQGVQDFIMSLGSWTPAKQVGSVRTLGTDLAIDGAIGGGALKGSAFLRSIVIVEITKGSPNYSLKLFYTNSPHQVSDASRANLLAQMVASPPALLNYTFTSAQTIAVNEATDGVFNAVNMFYSRTGPEIEIQDIALSRMV